jgi:hypothetical protein
MQVLLCLVLVIVILPLLALGAEQKGEDLDDTRASRETGIS